MLEKIYNWFKTASGTKEMKETEEVGEIGEDMYEIYLRCNHCNNEFVHYSSVAEVEAVDDLYDPHIFNEKCPHCGKEGTYMPFVYKWQMRDLYMISHDERKKVVFISARGQEIDLRADEKWAF